MLGLFFFYFFYINSARTIDIVCFDLEYFYSNQIIAADVIKYNCSLRILNFILTDDFIAVKLKYNTTLNLAYHDFQQYNYNIYCDFITINNTMKKNSPSSYIKKILPIMNVSIPQDIVFTNFGPKTDIISLSSFFCPNTNYWVSMEENCSTFISKNEWDSSIINTKWKKVCVDYRFIYGHSSYKKNIYGYLFYNKENENDDDEYNLNIIEISKTQLILSIVLIVIPFLTIIISLYIIGYNRYKKRPNKNVDNINTEPL